MKLILLVLLIYSANTFASSKWELTMSTGSTKVYKSKEFPKVYISVSDRIYDKPKMLDSRVSKSLYEKKSILRLIGISEWKIDQFKWDDESKSLSSIGSYSDLKGTVNYFRESHLYSSNRTIQFLLSSIYKNRIYDSDLLIEFVNKYKEGHL